MNLPDRLEVFADLDAIGWLRHAFTLRQPEVEIAEDRTRTLRALRLRHDELLGSRGIPHRQLVVGQQIHGNLVAWVEKKPDLPIPNTDGLATNIPGLPIGVYVADCCAVQLVDIKRPAAAVLHSGLKGTRLNIAAAGVACLVERNGSEPSDLLAVLSPCIRGCCYREEFADRIVDQLRAAGVTRITRHDRCTACDPGRYYSYNREKGRTGRMLAAVMIGPEKSRS
jgi:polyphenol oxidase